MSNLIGGAPRDAVQGGLSVAQDVVLPQMGESIAEGTITTWLKSVGDRVERDEALFEMSTDKVDAEIPSPAEGVLLEIKVEAGSTVEVGTVVAVIGEEGESTQVAEVARVKLLTQAQLKLLLSQQLLQSQHRLRRARNRLKIDGARSPAPLFAKSPLSMELMLKVFLEQASVVA